MLILTFIVVYFSGQIKSKDCCGECAPEVAYQKLVVLTSKTSSYTTQFSWSAFRYIEVSSLPPGWKINVTAIPLMTNLKWTASFESSNKLLNDIFEMCRNTHASNMKKVTIRPRPCRKASREFVRNGCPSQDTNFRWKQIVQDLVIGQFR